MSIDQATPESPTGVHWESSSPMRQSAELENLLGTQTTPFESCKGPVDYTDPATELFEKYGSDSLRSSPLPTWPGLSRPWTALRSNSESQPITPRPKTVIRKYSPNFLKRKLPHNTNDENSGKRPQTQLKTLSMPELGEIKDELTAPFTHSPVVFNAAVSGDSDYGSLSPKSNAHHMDSKGSEEQESKLPLLPICGYNAQSLDYDTSFFSSSSPEIEPLEQKLEELTHNTHYDRFSDSGDEAIDDFYNALSSHSPGHANRQNQSTNQSAHFEDTDSKVNIKQESFGNLQNDAKLFEPPRPLSIDYSHPHLHRYRVVAAKFEGDDLCLECRHSTGEATVVLTQSWATAEVREGDLIHVIGEYQHDERYIVVSDKTYLLIIEPDVLITCTNIADSYTCEKNVILRSTITSPGDISKPMIYGTIMHEAVQTCLLTREFSMPALQKIISHLVNIKYTEDLASLGLMAEEAFKELQTLLPEIKNWGSKFVCETPKARATIYRSKSPPMPIAVSSTLAIEENYWSPMYGLKGKLDATVELRNANETFVGGLEIKTSKNTSVVSHRAQVCLYSLLLKERMGRAPWLLLYYTYSGTTIAIPPRADEIRGLIQRRNTLVRLASDPLSPLSTLVNCGHICSFCSRLDPCCIYEAATAPDLEEYYNSDWFQARKGHITLKHLSFFKFWFEAVSYEGTASSHELRKIWCLSGNERQALGDCFARVKIHRLVEEHKFGLDVNYVYEVVNADGLAFPQTGRLVPGSSIIISSSSCINKSQGFLDLVEGSYAMVKLKNPLPVDSEYRIDFDEYAGTGNIYRGNLMRLLSQPSRLLELVVDLAPPKFDNRAPAANLAFCNADQARAADLVVQAQDYALILGMPGTGKTTTIVSLVMTLIKQGKTVLISALTHSAVNNIVSKLEVHGVDVLRLGKGKYASKIPESAAEIQKMHMESKIVATTSLSTKHWLFNRRKFDYCILDEASQLNLPNSLGPLLCANRFVLVGDHQQLQPLVCDKRAQDCGLGKSLFELLCETYPEAVVYLSQQYRMCEDIMRLSSDLIYNGLLKCGSSEVAQQKLDLNHTVIPTSWLEPVLEPENRVVFLNTDAIDSSETVFNDGIANLREVELSHQILSSLIGCGVEPAQIGIISIYRVQCRFLKQRMKSTPDVEVMTVDQAQGKDKDCILISFVRSNSQDNVGNLLCDWRRINVTFTRSRKKLILVGSLRTLKSVPVLKEFLEKIENQGWVWSPT